MAGDNIVNDVSDQYRNIIGTPSRRRILFGIVWIVFVLSLIVIAFAVMSKQDNSKTVRQAYASFQNAVNISVDPCVDFYNFSCGLWAENNPMLLYTTRLTTFSVLQDTINKKKKEVFKNTKVVNELPRVVNDAIRFYDGCSRQNSTNNSDSDTQLLFEYFDLIGGWPLLNKYKWDENAFDWVKSSAFLIKYLDLHAVIGVYSIDRDKNGERKVIYLKPPNILRNEEEMLNNVASTQMLYVILDTLNSSNIHADVVDDIERLTAVENSFYELISVSNKVSNTLYMSIGELTQNIPQIDWLKFLQLITNETLHEINETLTVNDTVAVDNIVFLKNVIGLLNSDTFSKLELANLFGWFIVKDIWILIPGVLKNYAKMNAYNSDDIRSAASNECYDIVLELFRCSSDYLYIKNLPDLEIQDSKVLTSYLKFAFQDIIKNSHWLDEVSKQSLLVRLSNMQGIIGFPDYLKNKTAFDKIYADFPLMNEVSLEYYSKILQYFVRTQIRYLKVPVNHLNWILPRPVSDVSAYYIVNKNAVVFPISLQNPPFYYYKGPWYLNYGAIGSVIGHEMMHGFDGFGDEENDLKVTWFSNTSKISYQKHAKCFKEQYNICDVSGRCKNNGTRTLRENIADGEGLHIAFEAYKKHSKVLPPEPKDKFLSNYSIDQMFFISFGSVWCSKISPFIGKPLVSESHSLPEVRVNKAVSNSESFALAFNCPKGSPMNPAKKCSIW